ncbi:ABC-type spermidine/putrescine transport system,ATPase component [Halapricum desulfuricans]|uniref:Molybdate/tungstate import ATP-binding protein WtpC n=1 Tax=Halapricum desulfuricans TaxID=2841257 RepID=A0A897NC17_9EURY|nr:ABC-type spermidine/putrescine transport system,ATPase component [Halapricum desulfuricans]
MGTVSDVALEDVSVAFGGVPALESVSLSIEAGEFFTLVGPSGCGKTTTLRAIAGFETPDAGTVAIGGEDVAGVPPEDRNVGIVFQNYALFPHMSVRENVAYGLRYRDPPGGGSTEERVAELLDLVDMDGMGDRDPESLSGGQQQRIALARALAPGPDVLLLDEPLSALDARLRERLRVVIREIQRELDITTVYVTHDQSEALAISDRVAVISDGRVEQVGPPESIYREPATRFVAAFVGNNNLLEGVVVSSDPPRVALDARSGPAGRSDVTVPVDIPHATDRAVTLSIRPESLSLVESGSSPEGDSRITFPATVSTAEFMGDAYRVHCEWGGRELLVKTDADEPPDGDVRLAVDPADVTVLDEPQASSRPVEADDD